MSEWRAHLVEDWPSGQVRIVVGRRLGDMFEYVAGFAADGSAISTRVPADEAIDPATLPLLPREVLVAIVAAVRPGPSEAEVAQLRETLDLERRRVDRVLNAHLGGGL